MTLSKHSGTELLPNTPQGHSRWHGFAAFGPPWAKLGPQKGLNASFAAKFGMYLGALTVFSGPVHCHVRPQAPALRVPLGSEREGPKPAARLNGSQGAAKAFGAVKMGVKMAQNSPQ